MMWARQGVVGDGSWQNFLNFGPATTMVSGVESTYNTTEYYYATVTSNEGFSSNPSSVCSIALILGKPILAAKPTSTPGVYNLSWSVAQYADSYAVYTRSGTSGGWTNTDDTTGTTSQASTDNNPPACIQVMIVTIKDNGNNGTTDSNILTLYYTWSPPTPWDKSCVDYPCDCNKKIGPVAPDPINANGRRDGSYTAQPVDFGGQWGYYADSEVSLVLLGHRYYDAIAGRFLTRDPIGYDGGVNLYSYTANNYVNEIDPSGHQAPSSVTTPQGAQVAGEVAEETGSSGVGRPGTPLKDASDTFEQAMNKALKWFKDQGEPFRGEKPNPGKIPRDNPGTPNGMRSADGKLRFRVEYDDRCGAHISVDAGKIKGPHFTFDATKETVQQIIKRYSQLSFRMGP